MSLRDVSLRVIAKEVTQSRARHRSGSRLSFPGTRESAALRVPRSGMVLLGLQWTVGQVPGTGKEHP